MTFLLEHEIIIACFKSTNLKPQPLEFMRSLISNNKFITQSNLQNLHNKGFLKVALGMEPIIIAPWCLFRLWAANNLTVVEDENPW
jgi:hypothetical protein